VIKFSKWTVLAAALAALVTFLDNLSKVFVMLTKIPLPDWAVVLSQYGIEVATVIMLVAAALTLNWGMARARYRFYRTRWVGGPFKIGAIRLYLEEFAWLVSFVALGIAFVVFEVQKARSLYTSYGLGYIVKARCAGDFIGAHDRSEALTKNRLWSKYSDVLNAVKVRYEYLNVITPRRKAVFGKYKDELPSEILQSDSYELRVLFGTNLDVGARARQTNDGLSKRWLESAAPCNNS
jgi:hypothetical protein